MKKDKIIVYISIMILLSVLLFDLFVSNMFRNKIILALFLCIYIAISKIVIKTKKVDNVNKKSVIFLMIVLAIIYVAFLYVVGIFAGFYENSIRFNMKNLYTRILPHTTIIICTELLRSMFVTKKDKKISVFITIVLILIDITTYIYLYNLENMEDMLALVGYVFLSSVSINLLCNYIVTRYGSISNILYRVMTVIYTYIFPILPDIYIFFQSTFRIVYPYIMYLIIDSLSTIDQFKESERSKKLSLTSTIISIIIASSIVLLVSCNFKYGIIVIGSSSMANSINKGDATIFEKYSTQELEEGQVIIFNKDKIRMIHRIYDKQVLNGKEIYYTKGDNNEQIDEGYITDKDIIGLVKFKIRYIGWPTIWLNDMFKN